MNKQLKKGDWVKLTHIEPTATSRVDWMNTREAVPGDVAIVEELYEHHVQLLCEPNPGFLDWRTLFMIGGLSYVVIQAPET